MDPTTPTASSEEAAQKLIEGGLLGDLGGVEPPKAAEPVKAEPVAEGAESAKAEPAPPQPAETAEAQSNEPINLDDYPDREAFRITAKVDGKESQITLKDLLRGYQTDAYVTQKSQQLSDAQKQWESQRAALQQQYEQNLQVANQVATIAQQELLREFQGVTPDDPARYLAAQQRLGAIQQGLSQLQQVQQQQLAQTLQVERTKLLEVMPEWRDPAKFAEASKVLVQEAAKFGFAPAELNNIVDHRALRVLHKASLVDALQAENAALKAKLEGKTAATLKLVRTAPPMASPGARTQTDPTSARRQSARQAMQAGKMRGLDAQAAVAEALFGGVL